MNNLKKVLALGLALVMLLGMFTVVSAAEDKKVASDLTDWNTVSHKDAVGLMVDLGIIKGMPDGSFAPTGNIDRASWAKMVYFAATGSEDADAFLGTNTGLNDIAGNWAESYISFLKANQYISGDNYGNYNPSANVTVAEACKMMLTVLGYDAEDRGYQNNTAWSGNIMTDAKRNGLMDDVDSNMTALTPLTRENAAEIVMNALNANTVISESRRDNGTSYVVSYDKSSTLGYDVFKLVKVTVPVTGIDANGFAEFGAIIEPKGFTAALGSKVKATADMAGETVNVYVTAEGFKWDDKTGEINKIGTFKTVVSSAAAKADVAAYKVITNGVSLADATNRNSTNYVAPDYAADCEYYLNGVSVAANALTTANIGKRGTVSEFYLNDEGLISVVKVYTYKIDKVEGDVTTKTTSGTLQVRIPGVLNSYTDADKVSGWEGLEDGDVVLYYETTLSGSSAKAYTFEKAEMINGKVTTYSGTNASVGTITVGGKAYRYTEQTVSYTDASISGTIFANWTNDYSLADEFNFWLDKNGDIAVAQQVTETMDASKVCLVVETETVDGSLGTTGALAARLLFVDGSTEIGNITKVATNGGDLLTVVDKKSANETAAAKQITSTDAQKAIAGTKDGEVLQKFFNYRATGSNNYELTELSAAVNSGRNWENVVTGTDVTVTKTSKFGEGFGLTADNNTTFIMGKVNDVDGSVTYSVAKGFANIHEMDASVVTGIAVNVDPNKPGDTNKVAKYVYLETSSFKDDAPDGYIFITGNGWSADPELYEDDVYLVNIVDTNGSTNTMRVTGSLKDDVAKDSNKLSATTATIYKFWAIKEIDENRTVSALGDKDGLEAELKDVNALGSGVIAFNDEDAFAYDNATKFIFVDMAWADDTDNISNKIGVREPTEDKWVVADSGEFNPENFFNASDVDATGKDVGDVESQNPNGATYISVQAAVIARVSDTSYADYVYVVRYLW